MLRREIKQFVLDLGGGKECTVTPPFTLCSALSQLGDIDREKAEYENCTAEKMIATAAFDIEEAPYAAKYSYLRVSGITSACTLYLNGEAVGKSDGFGTRELFDLGDRLIKGENKLTFDFENPEADSGFALSAEILRFNHAIIDSVRIEETREGNGAVLDVDITTVGDTSSTRGVATLISGAGQIYYGGFVNGRATVRISDPNFWYPQGLGVQNIYKLTINLYGEAEAEDSLDFKVGLRTLDSIDGSALSVNGCRFLPMGSVYIPEKIYLPDESRKRTAAFVTSAAMAGFNCFVLRGDRLPQNSFFDLCDVHGIAVIYESASINERTLKAIASVAHHPSFVHLDIIGEEDKNISEIIKEKIPGVTYTFLAEKPEYYGRPSIPSDRIVNLRVAPEDRNILSLKMEEHSGGACRIMTSDVAEKYLYAWSPSDFAYLSRLAQAENTRAEMLRCRMESEARGRAVFSEISSERLVSSSSLDTGAGWKALQYYAKNFFAPVTVVGKTEGCTISFTAINSRRVAVFGLLEYKVKDNQNRVIYNYSEEIDIAENSSRAVFSHDLTEYISSFENERYVEYSFTEGSSVLAKGTVMFVLPKFFSFKNPEIKAEISGADRRYSITLSAEAYAGKVELSFADTDAVFSDNCFDITNEVPVKINFTVTSPIETVKSLKKQLRIKSLYDIGRTE